MIVFRQTKKGKPMLGKLGRPVCQLIVGPTLQEHPALPKHVTQAYNSKKSL